MNENTLVAVSAYSGDLVQVENNLLFYQHHKCPVMILSPADAPITKISDRWAHCWWGGQSGWIGAHTLERQRLFFEVLLSTSQEFFLLNDADSICLSPELPRYLYEEDALWSNEVLDTNPGPSHLPKLALQPPYFFSRTVLRGLLAAAQNPPVSYYSGASAHGGCPIPTDCIDHWMLQVACGSGYPHKNFRDGASWETASDAGLSEMQRAVRSGKIFIHQVKTKKVLYSLTEK